MIISLIQGRKCKNELVSKNKFFIEFLAIKDVFNDLTHIPFRHVVEFVMTFCEEDPVKKLKMWSKT